MLRCDCQSLTSCWGSPARCQSAWDWGVTPMFHWGPFQRHVSNTARWKTHGWRCFWQVKASDTQNAAGASCEDCKGPKTESKSLGWTFTVDSVWIHWRWFPFILRWRGYPLCKLHMREVPTPLWLRSGVPQLAEVPPKADRGDPVVVARTGVQKMEHDEDVQKIGKGSNLYYLNYLIRFIYAYQI